jgi:hypothetical protein
MKLNNEPNYSRKQNSKDDHRNNNKPSARKIGEAKNVALFSNITNLYRLKP